MPVLQQAGEKQFLITVPFELVMAKKWKKGQRLAFMFNERGNIEIMAVS